MDYESGAPYNQQEEDFVKQGGLREMMYNARSNYRRKGR